MAISKPSKNPLSQDIYRKDHRIMVQWQQLTKLSEMSQRKKRRHMCLKVRESV